MAAATALIVGATALSAGAGIMNSYAQSKALKQQGQYEQQIYQQNARSLERQAGDTIERGRIEAAKVRRGARSVIGQQRTSYAGQGVDVNSGTALDLQDETFAMGEMDVLTVKNNSWLEAFGYKTEASNQKFKAAYTRRAADFNAQATLVTGGLRAAGDILEGAYKYKKGT